MLVQLLANRESLALETATSTIEIPNSAHNMPMPNFVLVLYVEAGGGPWVHSYPGSPGYTVNKKVYTVNVCTVDGWFSYKWFNSMVVIVYFRLILVCKQEAGEGKRWVEFILGWYAYLGGLGLLMSDFILYISVFWVENKRHFTNPSTPQPILWLPLAHCGKECLLSLAHAPRPQYFYYLSFIPLRLTS